MPLVNLTEAANLAGFSRSYFHTNYIKNAIISVDRTNPKNPKIDTSEILRVFGKLKKNSSQEQIEEQVRTPQENSNLLIENERLKAVIAGLEALVSSKEEQLKREQELLDRSETRAVAAEQQYRALLEDRLTKPQTFLGWLKSKLTT